MASQGLSLFEKEIEEQVKEINLFGEKQLPCIHRSFPNKFRNIMHYIAPEDNGINFYCECIRDQSKYQQGSRQIFSSSSLPQMELCSQWVRGMQDMQSNQQKNQKRISPQKHGTPIIKHTPKKKQKLNASNLAEEDNANCLKVVQQHGKGVVIQNTHDASCDEVGIEPHSAIHLNDSKTLGVDQKERDAEQKNNNMKAAVNLLTKRGITVTRGHAEKGKEKQQVPKPILNLKPVSILKLNSSPSIIQAACGKRQKQNTGHHSVAVPSNRIYHHQNTETPTSPPILDLTCDSPPENCSSKDISPCRKVVVSHITCPVCDRPFTRPKMLRLHLQTHQISSMFNQRCKLCPAQYKTHHGLKQHTQRYHGKPVNETNTQRCHEKPVNETNTQRCHGKPVNEANTQRCYGKPVNKTNTQRCHGKPVNKTNTQRRHGKPVNENNTQRCYGKPVNKTNTQRCHGKPVNKTNTQRRHGKPEDKTNTQRRHGKPVNETNKMVIPVVDLEQSDALTHLSQLGIKNYIPISQSRNKGGGYYGLPIVSSDSIRNSSICNLQALGATKVFPLGPLKPLPH